MEPVYEQREALPPLAWLAAVNAAARSMVVMHGARVETRGHWFIEGVWDGDFADGEFSSTDCVFGTGARVDADSVTFVSSAATTDYLYVTRRDGRVLVANSLPLLLGYAGDRLDAAFPGYETTNHSILKGPSRSVPELPTLKGSVTRVIARNLVVSGEGVTEADKPMPPAFTTYAAYHTYLRSRYAALVANARDRRRTLPMRILSTQSRGYDTTALNGIAAEFGVDTAFTVPHGKAPGTFAEGESGTQPNDDGTEICAVLGIPCVPIDRRSFEREFGDEYLYYAALERNQDVNLRDITRNLSGVSLLLTGALGELWYPRSSYDPFDPARDDALQRGDLGCHGLTEVRLEAGVVHLPVPYIGARRRRDIVAITESPEMDPWRLRTAYDRPIPRRLAEEAGVPREMFGQTKIATVVEFTPPPIPYGKSLREEYFRFLVRHRLLSTWQLPLFPLVHRINSLLWFANERRHRWLHYLQRAIAKFLRRPFRIALRWRHLDGRLFCFSANKRAEDYAKALGMPTERR